ncbi:hypothetical protein [Gracilibacillus alcaliphilus]|uniref:hypothetical protein n=1 Tax=Gracilibacillus alcaliphilus TaxID=1401441 RepID=UPI001959B6BE|nr:hypothetical protein [Gracilibacillus alcaliphilus]MBM7675026.1 hypothetical protein [Gracilibacillus alcaliphilus]
MKKYRTFLTRRWHTILCILFMIIVLALLLQKDLAEETIQYFPPDEAAHFVEAATELSLSEDTEQDSEQIKWHSHSASNQKMYLRQDISLVFKNGYLFGIQSIWKQNEAKITLDSDFPADKNTLLQSISYHHGEIHYPKEEIRSIQQMSADHLYLTEELVSFKKATPDQQPWQDQLDQATRQRLQTTWKQWMADQQIDVDQYDQVPLIDLIQFQRHPMQGFTQAETDQIMGQLWEGLYRNYLIPLIDDNNLTKVNMPLILLSVKHDHLLVLYNTPDQQVQSLRQQTGKQP